MKDKRNGVSIKFNILIKKEDDIYVAHCLELDIVATADNLDQVKDDIISLIDAQISYAFGNDNLANLFRPAPSEVWEEFYSCEKPVEEIHPLKRFDKKGTRPSIFIPPIVSTSTCLSQGLSHV